MIEHEQYYRKGGTYELPIEIYNDLIGQIEEAQKERNEYKQLYENALKINQNENKYRTELEDKYVVLQQENERLKNGYCELKEKCNNGECDCTNEEYDGMLESNIKLSLEVDRLNNIINELEKYIDDNYFYDDVGMKIFDVSLLEDKLKELKESGNND